MVSDQVGQVETGVIRPADGCRSIDINRLHRDDCLKPGWAGAWSWKRDDEEVARIGIRAEERRIVLSYQHRLNGGEWNDVEEPVAIVRVPCRYGGSRPYFICPGLVNGVACRRRVAKLHGPGRYFLCRHCYRLAYASQSEDTWDRTLRNASSLAVTRTCSILSRTGPRACGTGLMGNCVMKRTIPKSGLTKLPPCGRLSCFRELMVLPLERVSGNEQCCHDVTCKRIR